MKRERERERETLFSGMNGMDAASCSSLPSPTRTQSATGQVATSSVVTEDGISDHNGAILASINQAGLGEEEEDHSLGNSDSAFVCGTR